jgi:O-antigen/teichoic acid export membrane protein
VNHVGFNWTAYFRALGRTRPIATETVAATAVFLLAGIPLLLAFGLPGFAAGIAIQAAAALGMRAYWLQRLFPGFDFLRHAARAFLPTVPAAAVVLAARVLEPRGRTLAMALGELAAYVVVTVAATLYLESGLLREAAAQVVERPLAPAA